MKITVTVFSGSVLHIIAERVMTWYCARNLVLLPGLLMYHTCCEGFLDHDAASINNDICSVYVATGAARQEDYCPCQL